MLVLPLPLVVKEGKTRQTTFCALLLVAADDSVGIPLRAQLRYVMKEELPKLEYLKEHF